MRISAWATVIAVGFAGSILAGGCVVGSDDGEDPDGGGAGGGGSGGTSGAGGSSGRGGSSGSSGSAGSAGRDGGGGSGGSGGGATCDADPMDNPCVECMKSNCCAEILACANNTACSGTNGEGELTCIQDCVFAVTEDGGVVNDMVLGACAGQCAVGSTIAEPTNDAVACMNSGERLDGGMGDDCYVECLSGD
jgi:hypothetical protein